MFAFLLAFCVEASASTAQNERLVITSLRKLHAAQMTYAAISSNGDYGLFSSLREENLIDDALASANKYGYVYQMFVTPRVGTTPSSYYAVARPSNYRKSGVKSFYIDQTGELRGADRNGAWATATDPIIDTDCVPFEECAISSLRILYSAQMTYAATVGNGNYQHSLATLYDLQLIPRILSLGSRGGYLFQTTTVGAVSGVSPARFTLRATPNVYGGSTRRSFFMDETGVLRGADKNGAYATVNDPPIE